MLIGNVVTKLEIPHEPGEWVEVRKLNHRTLAKAAALRSEVGIQSMKSLGAELLTALRQAREEGGRGCKRALCGAQRYNYHHVDGDHTS